MEYQVVFYTEDNSIRVRYSPYLFQRFREIPSSRHFKATENLPHNEFRFSLNPHVAYLLHIAAADIKRQWRTEEFQALVERGKELSFRRFQANNQKTFEGPELERLEGFEINGWHYQDEAYARIDGTDGLALFMEPGCGKTKVVIDYVINNSDIKTVLVVGPNRIIEEGEWHRQIQKHWPDEARSYEILSLISKEQGSVRNRSKVLRNHEPTADVMFVLINYQSIWRKPIDKALLEYGFDVCVMDESHYIKSAGSKTSNFAEKLGDVVPTKFLLTGTPYPNNPLDIFGQYRFLNKAVFGTNFNAFKNRYGMWGGFEGREFKGIDPQYEEEFESKIAHFAVRVKQRPFPVQDEILYYHLPPAAAKQYGEMYRDFFTYINGKEVEAVNVLSRLMRLQQIAAGFTPIYDIKIDDEGNEKRTVVGWDTVHTAKKDFVKGLIADLPKEKPIVVFALLHEHMNQVREATEELDLRYGEVSGRRSDYQAYLQDEIDVLCIQITASEGLNDLVKSNIGIFYATGFYYGKYEQARARLARPGQEDNVLFYHIHAEGTVEEDIYYAVVNKQSVAKRFMQNKKAKTSHAQQSG